MNDEKRYAIAKEYVDEQLDVMRKFDAAPKNISPSDYRSLIERIAKTIKPETKKADAEACGSPRVT
jgi:hypothetical protein